MQLPKAPYSRNYYAVCTVQALRIANDSGISAHIVQGIVDGKQVSHTVINYDYCHLCCPSFTRVF